MSSVAPALAPPTAPASTAQAGISAASERWLVAAILAAFVILAVAYSLVVPAFETPDEIYHYAFARHLAQGGGLPVQSNQATGPWQQEGSQAPLYYLVAGALTAGIDQSDFDALAVFNPRANMGDPLYPGNKNRMLYSAASRPLEGTNLALHVGRWFSVLLGALTLWFVYRTARLAFPPGSRLPLVALALVAAMPQFLFISASFSNDNAIITAAAAAIFWLARLLAAPDDHRPRIWEWLVLGVLLGLAALSKLQGLGLFVLAAGVVLIMAWRRRDWRLPLIAALPVALPAFAIAGWWYIRNQALYGDWSGVSHLVAINGLRTDPLEWDDFSLEFRGLRYSFWGLFGWFNILLPTWLYTLFDLFSLAGLIGAAAALFVDWRRARPRWLAQPTTRVCWLLIAWLILSALLLLYWMNRATGSQGRLLFPALSALAILIVLGLDFWFRRLPHRLRLAADAALPALLLGSSLYALVVLMPTAYAAPATVAALPATAIPSAITYGDADRIELVGIEVPTTRVHPGEDVPITLYLTASAPLTQDYELFIQLLDETGAEIGNVTTHPGWGRLPTTLWQPGVIYADPYRVRITRGIGDRSPLLARVYTGFIHPVNHSGEESAGAAAAGDAPPTPIIARDPAGSEITPFPATVVVAPAQPPDFAAAHLQPVAASFGDAITLAASAAPAAVAPGDTFTVTLLWDAAAPPAAGYTAFVHLLDAGGNAVAGFDQAPAGTRFPTHYWQPGDRILSEFPLTVPVTTPPGDYALWAGLYDAASQGAARLPVTDPGRAETAHDTVRLAPLTVTVSP